MFQESTTQVAKASEPSTENIDTARGSRVTTGTQKVCPVVTALLGPLNSLASHGGIHPEHTHASF
jgi:hypothetical protein